MTAYLERELRYDESVRKGYQEIVKVAKTSPYRSECNGSQYVDFEVAKSSKVSKVRVLIDFRGEYFSAFFLGTTLPLSVTSPIRNMIHFTAKEAYDYIIGKAQLINQTN